MSRPAMSMSDYLDEVKDAVSRVLEAVWAEEEALTAIRVEINKLGGEVEEAARHARAVALDAEDLDDVMLVTESAWQAHFGERERMELQEDETRLAAARVTRTFSVGALSAALLQFGKQGLSLVHGTLSKAPPGRTIHAVELKEVVWQGRNQALHWEEGRFTVPVKTVFDLLAAAEPRFTGYKRRNMAFEIVDLLGWKTWPDFQRDMAALG